MTPSPRIPSQETAPQRRLALVTWLIACGCAPGATLRTPSPASTELTPVAVETPALFEARMEPVRVAPSKVPADEILASTLFGNPEFDAAVGAWVEYWSTEAADAVPVFLARLASYEHAIDSALEAQDLPPSLRFLPFIESGYNPHAASPARAVGMWQFMAGTAQSLGMEVSRLLDERRDPIRSTEGAAQFLVDLREGFGSWFLALAAYNSGPSRVRRILRRHAGDAEWSDSLFWALREYFPRETREFVPKLVAAILVGGSPAAYGVEPLEPPERFAFDPVTVPDATTLDVVAMAAEVPLDEIERLNPHFVRGMTPPGRPSSLRVPEGRGATFERNYAAVPPHERVTFVEHRVEQGDTLSHIAVAYGVLVADLHEANPGLRPRLLRIGAMLTVPVAPSVRSGAAGF